MALALKTISFNHDPFSASNSALNIRRNKDFDVPVPEYDAAIPRTTAESCAAYAIQETAGQAVFVRVELTEAAGANVRYEVRAVGGGLLGALDPQLVDFSGGAASRIVDFPLAHRNFDRISRSTPGWGWEFRVMGSTTWQPLVRTAHRIYLVLKVPPAPWTQALADRRNPWTDLLDFSCDIAAGRKTAADAAEALTKKVNKGYALRYDIRGGSPRYGFATTGSSFRLTNWIDYVLKGGAPANPVFCDTAPEQYRDFLIVNCYDCAASCALMAKVVGADSDYYFHEPFGYLKLVVPIGRGKCNNPFYGCSGFFPVFGSDDERSRFANHAYQKLGGSRNYDACLREWIPLFLKFLLLFIWLLIFIFSFGTINDKRLLNRADGWLVDLSQPEYNARTNDTSQPFEAGASGGTPALQTLQLSVT